MSTEPIFIEETYKAPIEVVWRAITDQEQMRQWFFPPMTQFQPEVGFETDFDVECEGQIYPHQWKVTEVDPEKRIVYDWRYGGFPGSSVVTWELSETPDGTKLHLTHTGNETFPKDNPIFSRESGIAGWSYFIKESLKGFLGNQG